MSKPYAESCDQNRDAILRVIEPLLSDTKKLLEIGSGTGQHAVYMGGKLPHLHWYTSDRPEYLAGIRMWLDEALLPNVHGPYELDVQQVNWPEIGFDAVFSANSAHIMHESMVEAMFAGIGVRLPGSGLFLLYGPFNYNGQFTSESNARFDVWLKQRDPFSGIRDFERLNHLASQFGMELVADFSMPENNRTLVWQKGV